MEEMIKGNCPACLSDRLSRTKNKCYRCYPYYECYDVLDNVDYYNLCTLGLTISPDMDYSGGYGATSYYGRLDKKQIALGLAYMILDEHIQNIIDKRGDEFISALEDILHNFKEDLVDRLNLLNKKNITRYDVIKNEIKILRARFDDNDEKKSLSNNKYKAKNDENNESEQIYQSLKKKGIIKEKV